MIARRSFVYRKSPRLAVGSPVGVRCSFVVAITL
jgi:hypothetical protein